ncbi:MAG TPA: Ku protein [Steroidobacteraceae bacterium]|nr:Ku protein [Steroidobacteraceae bacterium]
MAARSIASVTVSFGLVAIPVKVYSATRSTGSIHFNMLHKKDGSRLKQQYICAKEGVVVERDEIVKGYEFAKDQYVMFTPEEIKALEETGTRSIDIQEFVPLESVDPVYFDTTYYLAPDKGGAKPYTLFATALRESRRCAVGRWATRGKDHVVILRPIENALALHQLHFAPEVLPVSELGIEETPVKEAELKLAQQLVDQQTADRFEPTAYTDEVKARIEAAIQKKVEGEQITLAEPVPSTDGKVIDLMEALRASLKRNTQARDETTKLGERKPPKRVQKKAASSRKASSR